KSLIKTADNDVLTAVLKELSDGLGNNSGVFLNTGGDLKSTGTLEFSNFKATAYAVTINKLVNEADGISNNDNDTSLPTSAAVKDYVDTHVTSQDLDFSDGTNPGAVDLDSQVFAIVGTSNEIETSASGQQLQIGLPNDVTISGTFFATEFQGALAGTINSGTTAVTQSAGDNSTKVATTAYVDTLDAASDLDFSDGSVSSAVNLNTQVFSIQGTSNEITTTASGQSLTIALDSAGVDLPDGSTAITQTAGDNSTKVATTAYVDVLDAASDLDIAGDTGTGDVNLNTQTLTLQGTTNQVITAVSGQTTTFSLPSTVHRDLQGNVTGDLTGNADTATAWQTARDLSISGEATGTLSSVDGTSNISGAVTLTNSAVTGKVLTGLPTPAASTVQASDSILEGIGKLQSQINGIANGLQFQGTWDAATNTPTLTSGGGEVDSGTTTGQSADKLIDSSQNFLTTVSVGDKVINQVDGQSALVTNVDSNTSLTLDADIMLSGEAYTIDASPFLVQGHYYVVSVGGTTSLNGNANWAIGDWVIAGADNIWSKLDHTQIDGQGTPGNLPVWNTATTLTDSIVSESGTALTVTGSLSTTLGALVIGDFAVNTDKFTVNATTGDTVIAGNLNFPDDKRIRLGDSNDFQIYYDSAAQAGQGEAIISDSHIRLSSTFFNLGTSAKTAIAADVNNYVRLYHGGNQKLSTISTGVDITGAINADSADISGDATFAGNVSIESLVNANIGNLSITSTNNDASGLSFKVRSSPSDPTNSRSWMIHNNYSAAGNLEFLSSTTATGNPTTPRMVIDSSGNLLMGLTSATTTDGTNIELASSTSSRYILASTGTGGHKWTMATGLAGSLDFYDYTASAYRMRIDSSGVVSVTNSADAILKVETSSGTSSSRLFLKSPTREWRIGVNDAFNSGSLFVYNTEANTYPFLIDTSGNVSVLKTDSSTYSSITPVADLILSRKNTDNTNNETVGIRFDVTGWSGSTTGGAAIEAIQPSNASSADLAFLTRNAGTWGERMRIDSSGNVTIKAPTASGGGVLNLENTTTAVNGTDWGSLNFISNDSSTSASGIRASVVGTSTSFNGDGNLVFSTAPSNGTNTERMRIDSSGTTTMIKTSA
ncbi:MAG: hypothetical protein K0U20_08415, partial [Proteobacteria bacterium]|nr:hypothetical protein [Pseudomonadota bacterium]